MAHGPRTGPTLTRGAPINECQPIFARKSAHGLRGAERPDPAALSGDAQFGLDGRQLQLAALDVEWLRRRNRRLRRVGATQRRAG